MDQKKYLVIFKTAFYTWLFLILIISIYPGNLIGLIFSGDSTRYPGGEKTNNFFELFSHVMTYFVLSFLAYFSFDFKKNVNRKIIFLSIFSILMEIVHIFIPDRSYENYDLFMNLLGINLGLFVYYFKSFFLKNI